MHDEIIIEVREKDIEIVSELSEAIMKNDAIPEFSELGITVKVTKDICKWWDSCSEKEFIDSLSNDLELIDLVDQDIC